MKRNLELKTNSKKMRGYFARGDTLFRNIALLFSLIIIAIIVIMVYEMIRASIPAIRKFGAGFLISRIWDPVALTFGALPPVYGTLMSSFLALLISVPVSLGAAIFLSECAPRCLREPLSFILELLAVIPSVIYGVWGIFVLAPFLRDYIVPYIKRYSGFLPFFEGPFYGVGMLTGGIILAIMIIPTILSISREVIMAVPSSQREAALALGATKWEMITMAVLKYARSGILGAIILGLGRALGETMAVTMVIGNKYDISLSLFAPAYTMASLIANEFTEATEDLHLSSLIEIGLILFTISLILNIIARLMIRKFITDGAKR